MAPKPKRHKVVVVPNTLRSIFCNTTSTPLHVPTPHSTLIMPHSNSPQLQRSVLNQAGTVNRRDKANSSRKYWTVNVIDEDGVISEEKLKAKDVWSLQGKKVIIEFNRFQQWIDEGAGLTGVWMGELTSDVKVIPMNFIDGRRVPQTYKKNAVVDIEETST
ncbi:unnamed protein product [Cuscuta europaea]|nr:unnamed protein product [Cuscuta europaea]